MGVDEDSFGWLAKLFCTCKLFSLDRAVRLLALFGRADERLGGNAGRVRQRVAGPGVF